ncbi:MAG: DUF2218 domain-containing protein [Candidatus Thiodiazotropha endolucinida]|uniref:DUF2218 domain-containing protein n=1 Tax=Candidatus Thiodiazotropha taylori TaxID=2792791 RepID=A0A9E4TUI6_9GAMM|nr:DUF2218 domain-containing protein [Candidatus Thiodiazotropha taylori]MCW4237926.1 DUF2218 domain-containing protein [Candidatus Thiodiazotropha endolucinida]
MIASNTTIQTARARLYMRLLYKHFGHLVDVERNGESACLIKFGFGTGDMTTVDDELTLTARADDEMSLARVETVLESHLERFAFREGLIVNWSRAYRKSSTQRVD